MVASRTAFLWMALAAESLRGQSFSQRGFLELRGAFYPQTAPGDSGRAVGEALLRWEPSLQLSPSWKLNAAFDARTDTHRQVERIWRADFQDRRRQRPAFSLRRASALWHKGPLTVEAGKQFIRWGKADILNPTDRFAPRDYLSVTDSDFLAVTGARITVEHGAETLDLVVTPRLTPSRAPLLNQRWVLIPETLRALGVEDAGSRFPGRAQYGVRWNRNANGYEYSFVFYDGFHHLPLIEGELGARVRLRRYHPRLRLYGGDAAVPTRLATLKGEAAWFTSSDRTADEYVLYVIQAERTWKEWVFAGGYAGEAVTSRRNPVAFAADRGFARAFVARAAYTIDPRRSFAVEAAVRQNGEGTWTRAEYSHQLSGHLRATASFTLIRGEPNDFLGQYRRNSHGMIALRYNF